MTDYSFNVYFTFSHIHLKANQQNQCTILLFEKCNFTVFEKQHLNEVQTLQCCMYPINITAVLYTKNKIILFVLVLIETQAGNVYMWAEKVKKHPWEPQGGLVLDMLPTFEVDSGTISQVRLYELHLYEYSMFD